MSSRYREAKKLLAHELWLIARERPDTYPYPGDTPLALTLHFTYRTHRTADIDNLAGGFMDAANGILWDDDKQVAHLTVTRTVTGTDSISFTLAPTSP